MQALPCLSHGRKANDTDKKENDDSARMSWWEPEGKQPVGIYRPEVWDQLLTTHGAKRKMWNLLTIESFTMGCKVFTPVERIAGFSGKTIGTGSGNFWIICTTWSAASQLIARKQKQIPIAWVQPKGILTKKKVESHCVTSGENRSSDWAQAHVSSRFRLQGFVQAGP